MGTKTFDGRGQGRGEVARFTFGKHDLFWQYWTYVNTLDTKS